MWSRIAASTSAAGEVMSLAGEGASVAAADRVLTGRSMTAAPSASSFRTGLSVSTSTACSPSRDRSQTSCWASVAAPTTSTDPPSRLSAASPCATPASVGGSESNFIVFVVK